MTTELHHASTWTVPIDHPALAGHFPAHPIMPGVTLINEVLEHAGLHLSPAWLQSPLQIGAAKFLAPLLPGEQCTVEIQVSSSNLGERLRFDIRRGDTLAATGSFERATT